jgi:hypothetical protein
MRFAYIDSQGKEVGIPTVEALQLRIELGAIVSSTMFFDASSDRWAPAREHEIFRTLQRELTEKDEGGFVAEPPPHPPQPDTDSPLADPLLHPGPDFSESLDASLELDLGTLPDDDRLVDAGVGTDVGGFTLAPIEDVLQPSEALDARPPHGDLLEPAFEITPMTAREDKAPAQEPTAAGSPHEAAEGSRLEGGSPSAEPVFLPDADLDLEVRLSDQDVHDYTPAAGDALDLEPPMTEYSPEGPPGWADEDAGSAELGEPARRGPPPSTAPTAAPPPGSRSGAGANRPDAERRGEPPRRQPRSGPQSGRRRSRSSPAALIATLFLLTLVGGGGWFGWSFFHGRGTEEPPRRYAPVAIPALAPELEGAFRELADGALADVVRTMAEQTLLGLPPEPPPDWLAGQYLANASRHADVSAYWRALSDALQSLRDREESLFHAAFEGRMATATLSPEERSALLERATAGFRSALPERDQAYDRLADVFVSSLGLHEFLTENEEDIAYEPAAAGISRDPLLEAVPETRALGDEMLRRVDMITAALEAMGALTDRVTTQRLFALTLDRIGATPVH